MITDGNIPAPLALNENERLFALRQYCVLDTPPEPAFDDLTALGCTLFQTPIVLISLVDEHRQYFKSVIGLSSRETSRDSSFCAYALLTEEPMVVLDALSDDRFRNNALVVGAPFIRFYAGAPLTDSRGLKLGTFCVISNEPRAQFSIDDQAALKRLANLAMLLLEQRLYPARIERAENALGEANERYRLATRATSDGIWDWDCCSGDFYFSARLRSIIGLPEEEYVGTVDGWIDRLHPDDAAAARATIERLHTSPLSSFASEYRVRHEDGTWRWVHNRGAAVRDTEGLLLRLTGAITDVTLQKTRDQLTGLHSRTSLLNALESHIRDGVVPGHSLALLSININQFKRVNDSLGHSCGDLCLVEVAQRIEHSLGRKAACLAARIVGDEFAILLSGIQDSGDVVDYAERLHKAIQLPAVFANQTIMLSASIGIATADDSHTRPEQILQDADAAMHLAKTKGSAQTVSFSKGIREKLVQRLKLEAELRNALSRDELSMYYQPKVALSTGELVGFEALMRWKHRERGFVPPSEFIPVAEESDLILELGRWSLREAVRQLAEWRACGVVSKTVTMAVNMSPKQFEDDHLIENITHQLERFEVAPECLDLEITERILISDVQQTHRVLYDLKAIGVGVDLDDFGAGYSSLAYLQRFAFDSLKVDQCFVSGLGQTEEAETITQSIIALGRALNLKVIAEGIETPQQAQKLREMGCLYGQGYFFSKPLPAKEIRTQLERNSAWPIEPDDQSNGTTDSAVLCQPNRHQALL